MESALYDADTGFYSRHGSAGRRGDFLTSPEVGPLFGALVAERLDREWDRLGCPSPFVVVDAGSGPGTLARSIALAAPRCATELRYVLLEVSAAQRARHAEHLGGWIGDLGADTAAVDTFVASDGPGPRFASAIVVPSAVTGVIFANELLDNLPFDIVRSTGSSIEMAMVHEDSGRFELRPVAIEPSEELGVLLATVPTGTWIPWQHRACEWVADAVTRVAHGAVVVVDYGGSTAELAARAPFEWLRTYAGHERGADPLAAPGEHDITTDVAVDQVEAKVGPARRTTQAEWLVALGIESMVEEGRRIWRERAGSPDLTALRARSRVGEAEALLDPSGLGGFVVLEWSR